MNSPIPAQTNCPQCNNVYDTWKMIYCRRYSPVSGYICIQCRDFMRSIRREQFYVNPPLPEDNIIDLTTNTTI
jgi:hypothetical protein